MSNDIRGRKSDNRITVSINKSVVEQLDVIKDKFANELNVKISYTQAVELLIKHYNQRTKSE
jgi:hypothetical protein